MVHALVFDSGVGGLSVVEQLRDLLPDLHMTYAADDEFRPYGDKTVEQLQSRLPGLLQTLVLAINPDVVVLACNTASTTALAAIRETLSVPVIGVVPAIKPAAQQTKSGIIAVLGTPATVRHRYVDQLIADFADDCQVRLHGSTALVAYAESKLAGESVETAAIHAEIAPLFKPAQQLDTIVLACTHFPLLLPELQKAAPYPVNWIDSGAAIAARTKTVLSTLTAQKRLPKSETALLIGGAVDDTRAAVFKIYGFEKTVALAGYGEVP